MKERALLVLFVKFLLESIPELFRQFAVKHKLELDHAPPDTEEDAADDATDAIDERFRFDDDAGGFVATAMPSDDGETYDDED